MEEHDKRSYKVRIVIDNVKLEEIWDYCIWDIFLWSSCTVGDISMFAILDGRLTSIRIDMTVVFSIVWTDNWALNNVFFGKVSRNLAF